MYDHYGRVSCLEFLLQLKHPRWLFAESMSKIDLPESKNPTGLHFQIPFRYVSPIICRVIVPPFDPKTCIPGGYFSLNS